MVETKAGDTKTLNSNHFGNIYLWVYAFIEKGMKEKRRILIRTSFVQKVSLSTYSSQSKTVQGLILLKKRWLPPPLTVWLLNLFHLNFRFMFLQY